MESNFKRKWNDFFKDRNGIDEIGLVSFAFSITFLVLFHIFPKLYFFIYFYLVFLLYMIFRVLSKNVLQREKENSALLNIFKKKNKVRKQKVIKPKKQKRAEWYYNSINLSMILLYCTNA